MTVCLLNNTFCFRGPANVIFCLFCHYLVIYAFTTSLYVLFNIINSHIAIIAILTTRFQEQDRLSALEQGHAGVSAWLVQFSSDNDHSEDEVITNIIQ